MDIEGKSIFKHQLHVLSRDERKIVNQRLQDIPDLGLDHEMISSWHDSQGNMEYVLKVEEAMLNHRIFFDFFQNDEGTHIVVYGMFHRSHEYEESYIRTLLSRIKWRSELIDAPDQP